MSKSGDVFDQVSDSGASGSWEPQKPGLIPRVLSGLRAGPTAPEAAPLAGPLPIRPPISPPAVPPVQPPKPTMPTRAPRPGMVSAGISPEKAPKGTPIRRFKDGNEAYLALENEKGMVIAEYPGRHGQTIRRVMVPASFEAEPQPFPESTTAGEWFKQTPLARGAKVSVRQVPELAYGTAALVGNTIEKAFGDGGKGSKLKDWALQGYSEASKKTAKAHGEVPGIVESWKKAKDDGDLEAFGDWLAYATGYGAGQLGESAAVGLMGALAGSAAAPGPGTAGGAVGGLVAKTAVKGGIRQLVEKLVAKRAAGFVAKGVAEQEARRLAVKQIAHAAGAAGALGAFNVMQEGGSIYPEAVKEAEKKAKTLSGYDLAKVWGTTFAASGLESLGDMLGIGFLTGNIKIPGGKGKLIKGAATALFGAGGEAATEVGQTALERYGAGKPVADAQGRSEMLESGAMALVPGLGAGVVGSFHQSPQTTQSAVEAAKQEARLEPPPPPESAPLRLEQQMDQPVATGPVRIGAPPAPVQTAPDNVPSAPAKTADEAVLKTAVEESGAVYRGIQPDADGNPWMVLVNDPLSRTTLTVPIEEVNAGTIQAKLKESRLKLNQIHDVAGFEEKWAQAAPHIPREQIAEASKLVGARADTWAKMTGRSTEDYFESRLAGVFKGVETGPGALNQPYSERLVDEGATAAQKAQQLPEAEKAVRLGQIKSRLTEIETMMRDVPSLRKDERVNDEYVNLMAEQTNLQRRARAVGEGEILNQPAYHGSPHTFDEFKLNKIGTGEGHQAFGWGLYFAGNKDVAEYYREQFAQEPVKIPTQVIDALRKVDQLGFDTLTEAMSAIRSHPDWKTRWDLAGKPVEAKIIEDYVKTPRKQARLYKVEIPEDHEYLDLDKPLSEQSDNVKKALSDLRLPDVATGEQIYDAVKNRLMSDLDPSQRQGLENYAEGASRQLSKMGIPGLKFLDQKSREAGDIKVIENNIREEERRLKEWKGPTSHSKETVENMVLQIEDTLANLRVRLLQAKEAKRTFNYVLFDDKLIKILELEQTKGAGRKGAVEFLDNERALIQAFEKSDVSTVVHELGHVFRRDLYRTAGEALPQFQEQLKKDAAEAEQWAGVQDGVWTREAEEKWARGFENYMATGQAPSSGLQRIFDLFAEWIKNIYQTISTSAINVQISPEVKAVFDRMLTTEGQAAPQEVKLEVPAGGGGDGDGEAPSVLFQDAEAPGLVPKGQPQKMSDDLYLENRKNVGFVGESKSTLQKWKDDFTSFVDKYAGVISTRLANIDPSLKRKLRRFEYDMRQSVMRDMEAVKPFLEKSSKMPPHIKADFDLARKNGDRVKINEIVREYGLQNEYAKVRTTLDALHIKAKEAGYDIGYLSDYNPRSIKDSEGFVKFFQTSANWSEIQSAINEQAQVLGRELTIEEKAGIINSLIRGYNGGKITLGKPGNLKEREIELITPALNRFYFDSDTSLIRYVDAVNEAIEARKWFGQGDKKLKMNNVKDSIGAYVARLVAEDKLSLDQEQELREILQARFNYRGMSGFMGLYRDLEYMATMGSPISALTQIGDIGFSMFRAGPGRAIAGAAKAIAGKSEISRKDLGLEQIAQEFADNRTSTKALEKIFKLTGLTAFDALGKQTYINTVIGAYQRQAQNPTADFMNRLQAVFGQDTAGVIRDLQSGAITENVKYLAFNEILDIQPAALSEMPEKYLTSPNGRIVYMLKSFTLKQFDLFRREAFQKMASPDRAVKIEGFQNLMKLAFALILANATADEIKDFVLNRKTNFGDRLIDNVFRLAGVSKWTVYEARQKGLSTALYRSILPPMKIIDSIGKDAFAIFKSMETGKPVQGFETPGAIPLVGKLYYWWLGKGKQATDRKAVRERKADSKADAGLVKSNLRPARPAKTRVGTAKPVKMRVAQ